MTHLPGGWSTLLAPPNPCRGRGRFPLPAYSEFMPPPYVGRKPIGADDPSVRDPADDHGLLVTEYQELHQLQRGMERLARHLCLELRKAARGEHAFSRALLDGNPYWPPALAEAAAAGRLAHRRHVLCLALALSRTLDDKGRVRWTLFGSSEQGPARPFWQSFFVAPGTVAPDGEARFERLVSKLAGGGDGGARALGVRVLPAGDDSDFAHWREPLPPFVRPLLLDDAAAPGDARVLLTFRPFARLPPAVQRAFLDGAIELWPSPASLAFFGHAGYRKLARELPLAMQIPLLHLFPRDRAAADGVRVPQSGWLDEPRPHAPATPPPTPTHGRVVPHYQRSSRWTRSHRDEDEDALVAPLDRVAHVLFSTDPEQLGLYGKPMARNAQVWTVDHHLLLDGPEAGWQQIEEAARALAVGGRFGYRFQFPPMRAGAHDLYWQRPLVAVVDGTAAPDAAPALLPDEATGYVTAYARDAALSARHLDPGAAVELWPRLRRRTGHVEAAELFLHDPGHRRYQAAYNVRKLLEAADALGPLPPSLARRLLTTARERTLDQYIADLPSRASDPARGRALAAHLREHVIAPAEPPPELDRATGAPRSRTFAATATRAFEERYWALVAGLAEGRFVHKDNADHAGRDTDHRAAHDLDQLADHLHDQYRERIAAHGMTGRALVADHRFRWRTDFDYPWSGGWLRNQAGHAHERNVVCLIPGRDRSQAVIMADHYDTAYMEDRYEKERGGDLTRRAAAGADDNHSATAALLSAADVLLPLARAGQLARDVWLVHLTGEEFPSDCLGARHLVERLVEGTLAVVGGERGRVDLSAVRVAAAFVLDMVAHNNDHERYVFQIAHGEGRDAAALAARAHRACERWNGSVATWNRAEERRTRGPSQRMPDGSAPPPVVGHPRLAGEVRPWWHWRSSLYNTDAQIFSDAGVPVVLFMEDYDINRQGYHDTHDTMANIDLDYAAALVAIAIETVADAAMAE